MNYDIRKISDYFREIHSRYYIDTNGCIYTSMSAKSIRIMVDGVRININKTKKAIIDNLNTTNRLLGVIPDTGNKYFVKNDGVVLQRLSTRIDDMGVVDVCLIRVDGNDRGNRYKLSRLLAGCFIGDVTGMEVHHLDEDRTNNRLDNLKIMSFSEHRSHGNFNNNHNIIV